MFKKIVNSYWFNVLFAVLAGFFAVMQEVWLGGIAVPFFNVAVFVIIATFGISLCAEIVKIIFVRQRFGWKKVLIGGIAGTVVGLITLFLV